MNIILLNQSLDNVGLYTFNGVQIKNYEDLKQEFKNKQFDNYLKNTYLLDKSKEIYKYLDETYNIIKKNISNNIKDINSHPFIIAFELEYIELLTNINNILKMKIDINNINIILSEIIKLDKLFNIIYMYLDEKSIYSYIFNMRVNFNDYNDLKKLHDTLDDMYYTLSIFYTSLQIRFSIFLIISNEYISILNNINIDEIDNIDNIDNIFNNTNTYKLVYTNTEAINTEITEKLDSLFNIAKNFNNLKIFINELVDLLIKYNINCIYDDHYNDKYVYYNMSLYLTKNDVFNLLKYLTEKETSIIDLSTIEYINFKKIKESIINYLKFNNKIISFREYYSNGLNIKFRS